MTLKLTDTQLRVLSLACQRDDRAVHPLPKGLGGGAADKVLKALLARGLVAEQTIDGKTRLVATAAADTALGLEPAGGSVVEGAGDAQRATEGPVAQAALDGADAALSSPSEPGVGQEGPSAPRRRGRPRKVEGAAPATTVAAPRTPRENTKQAALIAMLRRPEGCTIVEAMAATGWLSHTVRGALAGALKKRLGLVVTSNKVEGRGRVYRIAR